MQLQKVISGTIEAIGYDLTKQTLHILFKDNTYYKYENVPHNVYQTLMSTPKKGTLVNRIGKIYKGTKQ